MSPASRQCAQCAAVMSLEDTLCRQCGHHTPRPAAPGVVELRWEADVKLGNPLFLKQLALLTGVTGLVMALLLTFLLAVTGDAKSIPATLMIVALVTLGLGAALLLTTLVVFRGRFRARFTLDRRGVSYQTLSTPARGLSRLAAVLGLLTRNPALAGAGVVSVARESERLTWGELVRVDAYPRSYTLALRNRWRVVMMVVCTPDNYAQVADTIARHLKRAGDTAAARSGNPLPALLFRSALVAAAVTPLFTLPFPLELDALLPLIILLFALATVWLVPLFGWVVIGASLLQAIGLVAILLTSHQSRFRSVSYRTFEILDSGDWIMLGIALAGLAYLCWHSWQALRGKAPFGLGE